MLIDSGFFNEYMGYNIPQFERWYDISLQDIKYIFDCYTEDLGESDLLQLKKAIAIQMDYRFTNQDAINGVASFGIGKFNMSRKTSDKAVPRFSEEMYRMLKDVFECHSLWVRKGWCRSC